jgi:hypothetical protein
MNGFADALVRSTAAQRPRHGSIDISVGRLGLFLEQGSGVQDLSRLAVSTLADVFLQPGFLQRMAAIGGQAFDSGEAFPARVETGVMHERVGSPSISTVQAPHNPAPQLNLVPVSPIRSRNAHNRGICASASMVYFWPFTCRSKDGIVCLSQK